MNDNAYLLVREYRMRDMFGGLGSSMFSSEHLEFEVPLRQRGRSQTGYVDLESGRNLGQSAWPDAGHGMNICCMK